MSMSGLQIHLEQDRNAFQCGKEIRGTAAWSLDRQPGAIELSLYWRTEGKGTQDIGIAQTVRFDNPGMMGMQEFSIKAPVGPFSFSGKLISILWALELACEKGKESVRKDIVISPTGTEVVCSDSIRDKESRKATGMLGWLMAKCKRDGVDGFGSIDETVR
jgi:hypothetical protein